MYDSRNLSGMPEPPSPEEANKIRESLKAYPPQSGVKKVKNETIKKEEQLPAEPISTK